MSKRSEALIIAAVACALAASAAHAQGAAPRPVVANSGETLEEVVVTAEKRSENLQALPQTVTAVSGDALLKQGVKDITDLSRVAPEVNVATGQLNNVSVRGVRSNSSGPTLDSANAIYVDGNYNARFTSLNGLFFDIERIEVLDGPQGTLYGRNSAGGAINIISAKPKQEFGGYGSVEVGTYHSLQFNGALNLPLTDTLAARFAYMRNSRTGYFTDSGQDALDIQGGRAELLWKPTANDSLLITAQESVLGGHGSGGSTIDAVLKNPTILTDTTTGNYLAYNAVCPGATPTAAAHVCTSQVVPINATDNPRHNAVLVGQANLQFVSTRNDAFALQYDHTFENFATLTAQASRMSTYSKNGAGATAGLQQNPLLVASGIFLGTGQTPYGSPNFVDDHWDSQEVRLTSLSTHPLQWVAGIYRFHESGQGANPNYVSTPVTSTAPGAGVGGLIFPAGAPIVAQDIPNLLNDDTARAVFGQATWTPSFAESFHFTGGVRYNAENKHGIVTITPSNGPIATAAFGPTGIFDQAKNWNGTTYKLNASYDITDHNMVYVDRATGFQSGGYGYGSTPAYEPTHIWAWEIGSKNRFLDNRLQVNLSAWYYQYSNQTANISDVFPVQFRPLPAPPTLFTFITVANAGTSVVRGQNIDVQWALTSDDRLGVNVQHIDAKYSSFDLTQRYQNLATRFGTTFAALFPGYSPTGDQSGPSFNYTGTQVGGSPKIAVLANYDHTFHIGESELTPQLVYHYTGQVRVGNQGAPNMPPADSFWEMPAFSTVDFTLTWSKEGGKYNVALFSRNLTDKLYLTGRGYVNGGRAALMPANSAFAFTTASYGAPRTFGISAYARF